MKNKFNIARLKIQYKTNREKKKSIKIASYDFTCCETLFSMRHIWPWYWRCVLKSCFKSYTVSGWWSKYCSVALSQQIDGTQFIRWLSKTNKHQLKHMNCVIRLFRCRWWAKKLKQINKQTKNASGSTPNMNSVPRWRKEGKRRENNAPHLHEGASAIQKASPYYTNRINHSANIVSLRGPRSASPVRYFH